MNPDQLDKLSQTRTTNGHPAYRVTTQSPEEQEFVLRDDPGEPAELALFVAVAMVILALALNRKK